MKCRKCGTELPDVARFCFGCGSEIDQEKTCYSCGAKMHEGYKFCIQCGAEDKEGISQMYDIELVKEQISNSKGILERLDKVAIHHEYYKKYGYYAQNTAVNGKWVFYQREGKFFLMDEDGDNKIEINLSDIFSYDCILGMNNQGVWFMKAGQEATWDDTDWWNEIICYNFEDDIQRRIKFNSQRAKTSNMYISNCDVYYVAELEDKQLVMWIAEDGVERILLQTGTENEIECVAGDNEMIFTVNYDYNNKEVYRFIPNSRRDTNVEMTWLPLDKKIYTWDLEKHMFWTEPTDEECAQFGVGCEDLIARTIDFQTDSIELYRENNNAPLIFRVCNKEDWIYFDGKVAYASDNVQLIREDGEGNSFKVSFGMYGETEKIIVSDTYCYVNYDGYNQVRLPREFSDSALQGKDNPEAKLIFGTGNYSI